MLPQTKAEAETMISALETDIIQGNQLYLDTQTTMETINRKIKIRKEIRNLLAAEWAIALNPQNIREGV